MFSITGKYTTAELKVVNYPGDEVVSQITQIVNDEHVSPAPIVIMPDTHAGKGCVIGYTQKMGDYVDPNVVGVDIGCGVLAVKIPGLCSINLKKLDDFIRNEIPHGTNDRSSLDITIRSNPRFFNEVSEIAEKIGMRKDPLPGIGSLGGGR